MQTNNNEKRAYHSFAHFPTVSVIVVTYNQSLGRILKTLDSILIQEDISFEIIICDDSSKIRYEEELKSYFSSRNFSDYNLVFHDHNEGTVSNYYSGLKIAKGKYAKLISPGDYLIEKRTLYKWVQFLKDNNAEWSFSDAHYYLCDHGNHKYMQTKAHPQIIGPYIHYNSSRCRWNYVALQDISLGAAIIGTTDIQTRYCRTIKEKGIRYCEDSIYQLMMFHGIVGCYFPEATVCYEYGTGISTSGDTAWGKRINEDRIKLMQIMLEEKDTTEPQERMVKALFINSQSNRIRKLFIRGELYYWLKCHFFPRLTPLPEEVCEHDGNT